MLLLAIAGCLMFADAPTSVGEPGLGNPLGGDDDDDGPGDDDDDDDDDSGSTFDYEELADELREGLVELDSLGSKPQVAADEDLVFWVEEYEAVLRSYNTLTSELIEYEFSVSNPPYGLNVVASDEMIVVADVNASHFKAYEANAASSELGTTGFLSKFSGYYPEYIVHDGDVLFVDEFGDSRLRRWNPSDGDVVTDELLFTEVGISGTSCSALMADGSIYFLAVEDEIWRLEVGGEQAEFLVELAGVVWGNIEPDGLYLQASEPYFYEFESGTLTNLRDSIDSSSYVLDESKPQSHRFDHGASLYGRYLLYDASDGIFYYNIDSGEIGPLLLDPSPSAAAFDNPAAANGVLVVAGFEENQNFVGRIDLPAALTD
jgi:hypothetical protein